MQVAAHTSSTHPRPAWAHTNDRRKKLQEVPPAVDPTEYAKKQADARAFAEAKRAVTNTQVFRWKNAELMQVTNIRLILHL